MDIIREKIFTTINVLNNNVAKEIPLQFCYSDNVAYKTSNVPPENTEWSELTDFMHFQGKDSHRWLHLTIPELKNTKGKEYRLHIETGVGGWDGTNPQFTVFINNKTRQAFDVNHTWIPLECNKELDVYIYAYAGMIDSEFYVKFFLQTVDLEVEGLYYDLKIPLDAMDCLVAVKADIQKDGLGRTIDNPNQTNLLPYEYIKIRDCLNKATMLLDLRDFSSKEFYESVKETRKYLKTEFYEKLCGDSDFVVSCIGHTHIDVAWLWTVAQTKEKAQRSFATVLNMMDYFDDYKFMSSQPQLYQYIKDNDPELYERIKAKIKEGRWEAEGSMWLEADTNLTSGESLIRQILFGKRFMKSEFGVDNKILWLPDVFGYSGALPQILSKCGIKQFFTTKMNWNETNLLPHDNFIWEGIDGSQVFAAFICTYVLKLNSSQLRSVWDLFKDKSYSDHNLLTFGFGDGGGGPTYEMMENYKRLKYGLPGMPKAKIETTGEFFVRQENNFRKAARELKKEPKWVGEMYLEMHRGTYTSIAKNKKFNRKCELLTQKTEGLCVANMVLNKAEYPEEEFRKNQTVILLNQFHDIIPGSSIKEVYDVTDKEYLEVINSNNKIFKSSIEQIKANVNTSGGLFVYNPNPFEISDYVTFDGNLYFAKKIPSHGWKVIEKNPADNTVSVKDKILENDLLKIVFDNEYHITSIYDKELKREVLTDKANVLEIFEDYPRAYDAWEITDYYKQKMWVANDVSDVRLLDNGIEITRKYQKSVIKQKITVKPNSKRIDFDTYVDWHEDHVLLKAAFPVDIRNEFATYDIQFGNIKRPTHKNTLWDEAKFEVSAHKWADLSENGYGVSLLNDCKYGYSIEENVMKLSLLKAATNPNPEADRGEHTFTYSLYPHNGGFIDGKTVKEGYLLNIPLEVSNISENNGILPETFSLANSDNENVVIETIKKAEDTNDVILRAYETTNSKTFTNITVGFDFKKVYICDMLENNEKELEFSDKTVGVPFNNFEIITLKFVL